MSYILDALKRAEAERSQTQPTQAPMQEPATSPPANRKPRAVGWSIAAATLTMASVAAGIWPMQSSSETTLAQTETSPIGQPASVPTPVTGIQPAPLPAVNAGTLNALPIPPPLPPGAPPQKLLKRVPLPPAPGPSKSQPTSLKLPVVRQPALPQTPSKPAALLGNSHAGQPPIEISGSSYSTNPALRMLIANGQVVKEGQELSPGLTLESIGLRSAVFNQGGSRFNVNY